MHFNSFIFFFSSLECVLFSIQSCFLYKNLIDPRPLGEEILNIYTDMAILLRWYKKSLRMLTNDNKQHHWDYGPMWSLRFILSFESYNNPIKSLLLTFPFWKCQTETLVLRAVQAFMGTCSVRSHRDPCFEGFQMCSNAVLGIRNHFWVILDN